MELNQPGQDMLAIAQKDVKHHRRIASRDARRVAVATGAECHQLFIGRTQRHDTRQAGGGGEGQMAGEGDNAVVLLGRYLEWPRPHREGQRGDQ